MRKLSSNSFCSCGQDASSGPETVSLKAMYRKNVINNRSEILELKSLWKGRFSGSCISEAARERYTRSLVRIANMHRTSNRITALGRCLEKKASASNVGYKLLEQRCPDYAKFVIKLNCSPQKDFMRPSKISPE